MTDRENKALYIAEQCRKAGMTLAGAAGVLANVQAESAFIAINVQDSFNRSLGISDEEFVRRVDAGDTDLFMTPDLGFGLVQWTAQDRKASFLSHFRKLGVSIGNFRAQVDYMILDMRTFWDKTAWNTCTISNDPFQCGYDMCKHYEICSDLENASNYRGGIAQQWYSFLAKNAGAEYSIPVEETAPASVELDEDGMPIPKTWPPRTLHKDRCSGWKEIKLLQILLDLHGYNVLTDGMFSDALEEKVIKFQQTAFPNDRSEWDGIAGPKTWGALGVKMS